MVEVEELNISLPSARRKSLEWLLTVFVRPGKAMREIANDERSVWLVPILLLTVLTLVSVLVAGPLRQEAAMNAQFEPPPNFEYMSPEQQQQYMQAQASASGTMQTHVFPGVGAVLGLWTSWFLLGALLHLILTMMGSRSTSAAAFNMAAWASLPFVLRLLVQISAMAANRGLINSPGLSGFVAADASGAMAFARVALGMVDIYLIWQLVLLTIGAAATGLRGGKAFLGVLITLVLVLALASLPGFGMAQMSGLNVNQPYFFFY